VNTVVPRRVFATIGVGLVALALSTGTAAASIYGRLIVRNDALPAAMLDTHFTHVQPPRSFLLVVTGVRKTELQLKWSLHCYNNARRESGGASGEATVTSDRWVKQVRANWIKHPAFCTGGVVGSTASSPVLVRIYAR
jgi:hypothetical protein